MTIHKIELETYKRGKSIMLYKGETIGISSEPLFSAARLLLSMGKADAEDTMETYRSKTKCLNAKVGVAAKLTVKETDEGFLGFVKWKPSPFAKEASPLSRQPQDVDA